MMNRVTRFTVVSLFLMAVVGGVANGATYYVNDSSTNGDVYCSAAGVDAASRGTNAATPMLSLTNLLAAYDLDPGDTVYVDTGTYSNYTVSIGSGDAGSVAGYVTIQGSTNRALGGTVFNRGHYALTVFEISGASYMKVRDITVRSGSVGLDVRSGSTNNEFSGVWAIDNYYYGFYTIFNSHNTRFVNCLAVTNWDRQARVHSSTNVVWQNCTFWGTRGIYVDSLGHTVISNSIIRVSGNPALEVFSFDVEGDYNCFILDSGGSAYSLNGVIYSTLADLQQGRDRFWRSSVYDPLFASPAAFDFHLLSETGRFVQGVGWTNDSQTSPAIDAGNPLSAYSAEQPPNGSRVNVGLHGNTWEASRSPTNARLFALTFNDGGTIAGTGFVYWVGANMSPSATVRAEYSLDGGSTWGVIATNIPATNETAKWETTGHASSARGKWRVVLESQTNVFDANDAFVSIHNSNLTFFVNDDSQTNDVYCLAVGASTNTGTDAGSPKRSIQEILDAYDVNPGDTIYVDSGRYIQTNRALTFAVADAGDAVNSLRIQGSTNAVGGTEINVVGAAYGTHAVNLTKTPYVTFADLTVTGAAPGGAAFYVSGAPGARFERVVVRDNGGLGFNFVSSSHNGSLQNCVLAGNGEYAIRAHESTNVVVRNSSLCNSKGVLSYLSASMVVSNSVICASGSGNQAFRWEGGAIASDYNVVSCSSSASVAYVNSVIHANLASYQKSEGQDWHSTAADPLFAAATNYDFHLRSEAGRWSAASWVTDTVTSVAIDMGDPLSVYTNEPPYNGSNINVGAYGNTWQASRSPTGSWLRALTYNDGGTLNVQDGDLVYWRFGNLPPGATARIELSRDSGQTWDIVETNIAAAAGSYAWVNTNFLSSSYARWRVVLESNTNIVGATTGGNFVFRNGPFPYYVNDASTEGDIYCSVVGNETNLGTTVGSPKASLLGILQAHDLEPGDIIYVDNGSYALADMQTVGVLDSGSNSNPVLILGSTNVTRGGTIFNASYPGYGLKLDGASYVELRDIVVTNAVIAVQVVSGAGCELVRVTSRSSYREGFVLTDTTNAVLNRCVAMNSVSNGIYVTGNSSAQVKNSVLWKNNSSGLRVAAGSASVSGSVFVASGSRADCYHAAGTNSIRGDYNDLFVADDAIVGHLLSLGWNQDTLSSWIRATGSDVHSLETDPLFADPGNADFHLKTEASLGRYQLGVGWVLDIETSPLIDSGAPSATYSNEPPFNGGRANIGLYGDTDQASKRRTNAWLHAASLRQGGGVSGTAVLHWVSGSLPGGALVRLELSPDGGSEWSVLTTGLLASSESYAWNTLTTNDTPAALWKVVYEADPSLADQTTNFFAIRNAALAVYVNDANPAGDVYTTGLGASTNWAATTARPLDSVASALRLYDLEPGDRLFIDTGVYASPDNPSARRRHGGASGAPVLVIGSTNVGAGGAVLQRTSQTQGVHAVEMRSVQWMTWSNLTFSGARHGAAVYDSANVTLSRVRSTGNSSNGFFVYYSTNVVLHRAIADTNTGHGLLGQGSRVQVLQSVLWSNGADPVLLMAGRADVSNSVVQTEGSSRSVFQTISNAVVVSDYNDIFAEGQAYLHRSEGSVSKNLSRWQAVYSNDLHSLSVDPLFASPAAGDYHLRSPTGRYSVASSGFVTTDTDTSRLVDGGDPTAPFASETDPNGSRLNIGLYGNDPEASRTPTNGWLVTLTLNDGGSTRGTNTLRWTAGGAATGQQVYIEYSADGGVTWSNIATNVSASIGEIVWFSTDYRSSSRGAWRIVSQSNSNIYDVTDAYFALNNTPLAYFVNDAGTNGDVYTTAAGNAAYDGLTEDTPLPSIQAVLSRYDLVPGDVILVDTGTYPMTNEVSIGSAIVGTVSNRVVIQGSTNRVAGGSVLDCGGVADGVRMTATSYIDVRDLKIRQAREGIRMFVSTNCSVENVTVERSYVGFHADGSVGIEIRQCAALQSASNGLLNSSSPSVIWQNGLLWSNKTAVRMAASAFVQSLSGALSVSNSVFACFGSSAEAFLVESGNLQSDYNDIYLAEGAIAGERRNTGFYPVRYETVSRWVRDTGLDQHSLSEDPGFADAVLGDFHPKSHAGRVDGVSGLIVTDAVSSVLIDAGGPDNLWTNEPMPNGGRMDIGLYGGTPFASRSPTNPALTVITLNDGGRVEGTRQLHWLARGAVTGHTVRLQFSADGGSTWSNIVAGVAATSSPYAWNTALFTNTLRGLWGVTSEADTNIYDRSTMIFAVRNQPFRFYVNDAVTTGDVYTANPGHSTNSGLTHLQPMDSLTGLLAAWDLEPGDTVYIDTGSYSNASDIAIGQFDGGDISNLVPVTLQGSTNYVAGGTVLGYLGGGLDVYQAARVSLRNLRVTSGATGLRLRQTYDCSVQRVDVDGGAIGMAVDLARRTEFRNCSIKGASSRGLHCAVASNTVWQSGVIWSNPTGVLMERSTNNLQATGGTLTFSNSVLAVFGQDAIAFRLDEGRLDSDYNDIWLVNGAMAGTQVTNPFSLVYANLSRWARDTRRDVHSVNGDPEFVSAGSGDFHLKSRGGRYDLATGLTVTDLVTSVLIDAGAPQAVYSSEPPPNGARVNIGVHGNTAEASRSPTNSALVLLSLNDGGRIEGASYVYWNAQGNATAHTVRIEYSWDGGLNWTNVVTGLQATASAYLWDTTIYTSSMRGVLAVVSEVESGIRDESAQPFALRNQPFAFFVNDASTNGDVYAWVAGYATNSGLTRLEPALSLSAVLDTWDLEAGDQIYVDTGSYTNSSQVLLSQLDTAGVSNPVRVIIQGSTNESAGGTVLDRQGGDVGIRVSSAAGLELRNLRLRNAQAGLVIEQAEGVVVDGLDIKASTDGMRLNGVGNAWIQHSVVRDASQAGLSVEGSYKVRWRDGVIWSNVYGVRLPSVCEVSVSNSIVGALGSGHYAYHCSPNATLAADYNNVFLTNGARAGYRSGILRPEIFENVARWVRGTGQDRHSLSHEPGLANPSSGDFHLKSQAGRWDPAAGSFVTDTVSSVLIDAGHVGDAFASERDPNGGRINIGLHGNTAEASLTPTNATLVTLSLNDGGRAEGAWPLYWFARGHATSHTVRLEYSGNAGAAWQTIATGLQANAGVYVLDTRLYPSTILGAWKVVSEVDTNVFDQTDFLFAIRNTPLSFYVNDGDQNGDVYTSGEGVSTNYGTDAAQPRDSIQGILDLWDIEPGDTIYVDSGTYYLSGPYGVHVGQMDAWDQTNEYALQTGYSTNRVLIQGSTNESSGGTALVRLDSGYGIYLDDAPGVALADLRVRGATAGVRVEDSTYGQAERVWCEDGDVGFDVDSSDGFVMDHCVARDNTAQGLYSLMSEDVQWSSGVFWSNKFGAYLFRGGLSVENSVIAASGSDAFGLFRVAGSLLSDYNDIYLQNGAFAGGLIPSESMGGSTDRYESVFFWSRASGTDTHTLSTDPGFVNAAKGDFHLKTTAPSGRYDSVNCAWTNDTVSSGILDAGDPSQSYSAEPVPNGGRMNIGLYGNTAHASRTPTNGWFSLITLNDQGSASGVMTLRWVAGGAATGHMVHVDFSPVGGVTWTNIATNVAASAGSATWYTTNYGRSAAGLIRIVSDSNTNYYDVSDQYVTLRDNSGSIPYFVNDSSTNGDVYTSSPGSSTNQGIVPFAPASSVQAILAAYKLEAVDIVYVDTGVYNMNEDLVVGDLDSGSGTNRITIQGSTNGAAGGTILDRQVGGGGALGISLEGAEAVEIRDVTVRNADIGVNLIQADQCVLRNVRSEGNGQDGFYAWKATDIAMEGCVSWNNPGGAGLVSSESSLSWVNGVIWGNENSIRFEKANTNRIWNSILQASGSGRRVYVMDTLSDPANIRSDYNNLVHEDGAIVAERAVLLGGNEIYGTVADWQAAFTQDIHGLSHEPLFVDADSGDFHLMSEAGRYPPGASLTNDLDTSPMIDVGDPSSDYSREQPPNGARIDLGAYGNTPDASLSLTNPWLLALSFNDGGTIKGTNTLRWVSGNLTNGAPLRLEFSRNNGVEWIVIESNVVNTGTGYVWDVSQEDVSTFCKWRVVSEENTNIVDEADSTFAIKNSILNIFVNDATTDGDIYTHATGAPFNSGLTNTAPLESPADALSRYPIGAGDTIYIDTGYYTVISNMALSELNRGAEGAVIRIVGSTNDQYGGTVIDRADPGVVGLDMNGTRYVEVEHLRFTGADKGVSVNDSVDCSFTWVQSFSNASVGFEVSASEPVSFLHCAAWNNAGWGLSIGALCAVNWDQGVLWSNRMGAVDAAGGSTSISNSILHSVSKDGFLYKVGNAEVDADYNIAWVEPGAKLARDNTLGYEYYTFQEWQRNRGVDEHSGILPPLFVDAGAGDFHLKSQAGHYTNGAWASDTNTSWAIDAGDPLASYGLEPPPNGTRMNIGLYGNTSQASKSLTNEADRALLVVSLNDGGLVTGSKLLYWLSRGLSPTNRVRLEYSENGGVVWTSIVSDVSVATNGYLWDVTSLISTPIASWRVTLEGDTNISDTVDATFIVRNGPITFYVNDSSQVGDIYSAAVGSPLNDGLRTNTPKSSIQDILAYDLEGGDRVLVDTGYYVVTNDIFIGALDGGVSTAKMSIVGSTNLLFGGSVLHGQHTNYDESAVFQLRAAEHVVLAHFTVEHADYGLNFQQDSKNNNVSNLLIRGAGTAGIRLARTADNLIRRSVVTRTAGVGVDAAAGGMDYLDGCVIWSNADSAVSLSRATLSVSNSILYASGEGDYCFLLTSNSTIRADFNDLFVTNNAGYGSINGVPQEGLPQWVAASGQDVHSLSVNPNFYNTAADDYHLKSQSGRYQLSAGGFVTNDTVTSYLIDTGATNSPYADEPEPNGSRRNIGLYGGTPEASKSRTNNWLFAMTASSGGRLEGTFYLVWAGGGLDPTNRVALDYSYDNGVTWTNIGTSLVSAIQFIWDSSRKEAGQEKWPSSPLARWKLTSVADTNLWDMTDSYFALRNRLFTYYVNDGSTIDDIYTSAIGSDTNLGIFADRPKETLNSLLKTLDVEGEDVIYIDTGNYLVTTNDIAMLGPADQGKAGLPVYIYGNTSALVTVLTRFPAGDNILTFTGDYVYVQSLALVHGGIAAAGTDFLLRDSSVTNGSITLTGPSKTIERVSLSGGRMHVNAKQAAVRQVTIQNGGFTLSGTNVTIENSLVYGTNGPAVLAEGVGITLRNNTLASGGTQFEQAGFGGSSLENNILVADGTGNFCINWKGGTLSSDYNDLLALNGAWIGSRNGYWERLAYWQRESGNDANSLSVDPLFANEAAGDYHLKSTNGRWTASGWVTDAVHSAAIDMGSPATVVSNEPDPNGGRVNLGAYGNTVQASKSRVGSWLLAMNPNDGGVMKGTNTIRWSSGGLAAGALVRLEYSMDNGVNWTSIVSDRAVGDGQYSWATPGGTSSLQVLWRVVLQSDTNVQDQVDTAFAIRNSALKFYVNDGATAGDVYTRAVGSDGYLGISSNRPKATLQAIFDAYDTEGGDVIYVDTGTYPLSSNTLVIWSRGGEAGYGNVVVQGSSNGTVLSRGAWGSGNDALDVKASYMQFRDLTVQDAYRGVLFDSNRYSIAERLVARSNEFGIVMQGTIGATSRNVRVWDNRRGGVDVLNARTTVVENCTFVGNSNFAYRANNTVNDYVQNNIFYIAGSNDVALAGPSNIIKSAFIDYNVYYFADTATIYGTYTDLRGWQLSELHDYRSAITNPLLADAEGGDFHLQSAAGRFVDGAGWVNDAESSWAIDKGNPNSAYGLEPQTNGNRVNIGAYGNTEFASKGGTNVVVYTRTLNTTTYITETNSIWPLVWTVVNVPPSETFKVQYSGDGGLTWVNIATGVNAYTEYQIWNTSPLYNSHQGRWRVVGESDTNNWDINDAPMDIFYGEYEITDVFRPQYLNNIIWRGAWGEHYTVQYADRNRTNEYIWTNAVSAGGANQDADFVSTVGGDFQFEDVGSSGTPWRVYRILQE